MRCSQPYGLPGDADEFLRTKAVRKNVCKCCGKHDGYDKTTTDTCGMFDDIELCQYKLKDGRIAKEYVQQEIWSSGPMIWFGLLLDDGKRFEWPEETFEGVS